MAESIAELLVSLGLDTKQFDSSISKINTSTKQMEKSFSLAKDAIKNSEDKLSAYSNAIKVGQDAIDKYKTKLEALSNNYSKAGESVTKLVVKKRELEQTLNKEKVKLQEIGQTLGKSSQAYKDQEIKVKGLEKELSNTDKTISKNISSMRSMENQMQETSNRINSAEREVQELNNEFTKLSQVKLNNLSEASGKLSNGFNKAGEGMKSVSSTLQPLATGITAVGGASATMGVTFENNMTKVGTLIGKGSKDMSVYKDQVKSMANESGQSMNDFSASLYDAVSATGDLEGSIKLTADAGKLAKGGFTDTASAVDILTTAINGYGLSMDESSKISDILIQTQNKGKTTVGELSKSLGAVIPIAGSVKFNMEELGASMALMTSKGIATSESATYLKSMLSELGKSGSVADKALRELSGKGFTQLKAEGKPTSEILNMLANYASKSGKTLKDMFGSVEAGSAALVLASGSGEEYNTMLGHIKDSSGQANTAFDTMSNTAQGKLSAAFNDLKNTLTDLGIKLIPVVTSIAEGISSLADKFSNLSPTAQNCILILGGIVAIGVPLLSIIGSVSLGIGTLMGAFSAVSGAMAAAGGVVSWITGIIAGINPVVIGVGATIAALALAWKNDWMGMKDIVNTIWNAIKEIIGNALNIVKSIFNIFKSAFTGDWEGMWNNVKQLMSNVWEMIKDVVKNALNIVISILVNIGSSLLEAGYNAFLKIKDGVSKMWENFKTWWSQVLDDPVQAIKNIGSSMYEAGKGILNSMWEGCKSIWGSITGWFNEKLEWIKSKFSWISGKKKEMEGEAQSLEGMSETKRIISYSPTFNTANLDVNSHARYSNQGLVSQSFRSSTRNTSKESDILDALNKLIKLQTRQLGVSEQGQNVYVDNNITLDGRVVAKATAPYIRKEIDTLNRREVRIGGNF